MPRLFIGLRPPPEIRRLLIAAMGGVSGARWQSDAQLHLTLRFLGEVPPWLADDVAVALGGIRSPAPQVAIAGTGRFARSGRTDAIWAGVQPAKPIAALHRKIERAVTLAGAAPEPRAFHPHITLARLARGLGAETAIDRYLADHAAIASPAFAFEHLMLFESRLGSDGAAYDTLARWPLG